MHPQHLNYCRDPNQLPDQPLTLNLPIRSSTIVVSFLPLRLPHPDQFQSIAHETVVRSLSPTEGDLTGMASSHLDLIVCDRNEEAQDEIDIVLTAWHQWVHRNCIKPLDHVTIQCVGPHFEVPRQGPLRHIPPCHISSHTGNSPVGRLQTRWLHRSQQSGTSHAPWRSISPFMIREPGPR